MLLDELIPVPDAASRHSIRVAAPPARVYQAARAADLGAPAVVRVLMGLRSLPALAAGLVRGRRGSLEYRPSESIGGLGFTVVAERPGEEVVLGIMGRFWRPTGGIVAADAERFRVPPPPGLAQGLWNFRVEPVAGGTLLSTETRVRCSDPETRRRFLRYWRVIRLGSGLIRRSLLRRIKSSAERSVG